MLRAKLTGKQLAKNVADYAATRPQLFGGSVQNVLIAYLTALCESLNKPSAQSQPAGECRQLFGLLSQYFPGLCESLEKPPEKPAEKPSEPRLEQSPPSRNNIY
jgi:hypothetical protein